MEIFTGNGLSLHKRENRYYIRYMAGEIVSWIVEIEVTQMRQGKYKSVKNEQMR